MAVLLYKVKHPELGTVARVRDLATAAFNANQHGKGCKVIAAYLGTNGRILYTVKGNDDETPRNIFFRARTTLNKINTADK